MRGCVNRLGYVSVVCQVVSYLIVGFTEAVVLVNFQSTSLGSKTSGKCFHHVAFWGRREGGKWVTYC